MAFADLNLSVQMEFSPEELGALDKALTHYRETMGASKDGVIDQLSSEIKALLLRSNQGRLYLDSIMDAPPLIEEAAPAQPEHPKEE